ncbi:MAG: type II toxin-antitoxin system Phd/YefM family antitoxin [Candidatus Eremiobacteraeota bacterium]|nr:type II toxin-antitoxin system Phd/YefM family antitoxin [Candidatus Eremiobacteraeota bacterium]
MKTVNMHEAKTNLSRLVQEVRKGKQSEIVIAIDGVPAARLVPYEKPRRIFGLDRGLFVVPDDFDAPVTEIVRGFEQSK